MRFTTSIFAALGLSALNEITNATPVIEARDIWDPTMTYPDSSTIWYSDKTYTVTWDTTDMPVEVSNPMGRIDLRFQDTDTPVILADGFDVRDGHVEVTVPLVQTATFYSLVLYGDHLSIRVISSDGEKCIVDCLILATAAS